MTTTRVQEAMMIRLGFRFRADALLSVAGQERSVSLYSKVRPVKKETVKVMKAGRRAKLVQYEVVPL